MVAGFQPGENQNPLPRAAGRFDHHPPLAGRRQRRLLQEDPQTRVREPPPGMPPLRPLCPLRPPGPAQRRHLRPGAGWTPGLNPGWLNPDEPQLLCRTRKKRIPMWTEYQRHSVRTRKKKSRGGQSTNSRGTIRCFLLLAAPFRCSAPVFHPGSPAKIVSTPYIYRDELPISITHFWL